MPLTMLVISAIFGLLVAIPLFRSFFSAAWSPQRYPNWYFPAVATGLATVLVGMFLALVSYLPFVSTFKVSGLVSRRPWLLGRVHGTFSAAFTTIWHGDLGIQLVSQDLLLHLSRNAYVIRSKGRPFALMPTSSFLEKDWHIVLDTLALKQTGFLQAIPPSTGSHVCVLDSQRLSFLEMRLRGYRWVGSTGGVSWIAAVLIAFYFYQSREETVPLWFALCLVPVLIFLLYLFRVLLWTWHTKRQFSNETRGYLTVPKGHPERVLSWFNDDVVFWCTGRTWLHVPRRYVDKVRVGFSVIEFRAAGTEMLFHREGFQSHANWVAACEAVAGDPQEVSI